MISAASRFFCGSQVKPRRSPSAVHSQCHTYRDRDRVSMGKTLEFQNNVLMSRGNTCAKSCYNMMSRSSHFIFHATRRNFHLESPSSFSHSSVVANNSDRSKERLKVAKADDDTHRHGNAHRFTRRSISTSSFFFTVLQQRTRRARIIRDRGPQASRDTTGRVLSNKEALAESRTNYLSEHEVRITQMGIEPSTQHMNSNRFRHSKEIKEKHSKEVS